MAFLDKVRVSLLEDQPFVGRVIESDFNQTIDGWGFVGDVASLSRIADLGQSGATGDGYLRATDAGTGGIFFLDEPDAYLGDRSAFYGGTLSYAVFPSGGSGTVVEGVADVRLIGAGLTLEYDFETAAGGGWTELPVIVLGEDSSEAAVGAYIRGGAGDDSISGSIRDDQLFGDSDADSI